MLIKIIVFCKILKSGYKPVHNGLHKYLKERKSITKSGYTGYGMREEILRLIENKSRIDLKEAAILLGMEEAEVANAIAEMEKEKVICGYYTMIDWEKTNEDRVTALIEVKVTPQRGRGFDDIADRIMRYDEVKAVYLMSGGFDFTVIIEEKTMKEIAQFVTSKLSTLDSILNTATHFILKKYKDYGTILVVDKEERMLVTP